MVDEAISGGEPCEDSLTPSLAVREIRVRQLKVQMSHYTMLQPDGAIRLMNLMPVDALRLVPGILHRMPR